VTSVRLGDGPGESPSNSTQRPALRAAADAERLGLYKKMRASANHITDAVPLDDPASYVLETPGWLRTGARLLILAMGLALAVLSARSWGEMPFAARAMVVVLAPAMTLVALWNRPWRKLVKFVAYDLGIAFPSNEQLVLSSHTQPNLRWLLVPWENISNIRLAREVGDASRCVAFDVRVSAEERESFFRHVDKPRDGRTARDAFLSVAYADSPPSLARTHAALLSLKAKHET
jgi:hypothetical protein